MMEREVLIVICVEKTCASGWIKEGAQEKEPLKVGGEVQFQWNNQLWEQIFYNLQLNQDKDVCRILLYSNQALEGELFPIIQKSGQWELPDIAKELPNLCAREWYLNGCALRGRFSRDFPSTNRNVGAVYLYTYPALELPNQTGSHTPLPDMVQKTFPCQEYS